MENKTKIKFNNTEFVLKQNLKTDERGLKSTNISVKKMTVGEKVKETSLGFFNFIKKPFNFIIKAINKPLEKRKIKKEKIKKQEQLDEFFIKNYGTSSGHIKEIIKKLETKYVDDNTDFESLRQKNIKEINSIKHKSPTLVDPDAILEHNSEDNSGKPELKDLIKKDDSVATEILTATPKSKKLKAKAKILVKTQV